MRNKLDFPTLRQLRAFETVAAFNSFGAAARELGLSQPAVTQMVAHMESALAVSLLERRRTGAYLTP
ncbi:MAG: LysR family transcriptional regulator, partial [Xanthobacteraceae bacterium]